MNYSLNKLSLVLVFSLLSSFYFSQTIKTSFFVNGKCDMCKDRIEKALDVKGINFANWDEETKICKVTFNSKHITEDKIQQILAEAGHDTPLYKATDKAYNSLHRCCHYNREE